MKIKVLVVGSGAREHTLVWKIAQSPLVKEIYAAPGNAGTAQFARNLEIKATDIDGLLRAAAELSIDLTVVGPEAPLAAGIADRFQEAGLAVFGASRAAAEIESSKIFAKELMQKYRLPCARSASFTDYRHAADYARAQQPPVVIKADGLAAGKGVVIAASREEAVSALASFMQEKSLGEAGSRVLVEEHLAGREMSFFVFTDGDTVIPLVPACDYKRVHNGDRGPNTGGMGSYSPPHFLTEELNAAIMATIMKPAVSALKAEKRTYQGLLYGGLMITPDGPKVLEFNARFGDPETQVVLPRLKTDLVEIMLAVVNKTLHNTRVDWSADACVGVVMASGGYPGSYRTGLPVSGLNDLDNDILVFHAGTVLSSGAVVTAGGRVLTVVASGDSPEKARARVYANLPRINFAGCHYRRDIARIQG